MSTLMQSSTEDLAIAAPEKKVWTDEAFMALPDDGHRYEIVNGELIDMGNSGALHGYIAIILSSALFSVVIIASCLGTITPLILDKLGINPALASGPFITTANDLIGIAVYFGVASWLYHI